MKSRFSWTILAILLRVFPILACGVGATVIPLTPCAEAYPGNPMVHQSGTAIVDGGGRLLRRRGVNLGGRLHWERWDFSRGADISKNKIDAGLAGLVGQAAVDDFHQRMYEKFIAKADTRGGAPGDGRFSPGGALRKHPRRPGYAESVDRGLVGGGEKSIYSRLIHASFLSTEDTERHGEDIRKSDSLCRILPLSVARAGQMIVYGFEKNR